jgi:manganese transport protein
MEALSLLWLCVGLFIRMIFCATEMDKVILGLIPSMPNEAALYIAIGIIGATVMPQFVPAFFLGANQKIRQKWWNKAGLKIQFHRFYHCPLIWPFVNAAILILWQPHF